MSHAVPSFLEDHISQVPALQLLQNLGWQYLTPEEAVTRFLTSHFLPSLKKSMTWLYCGKPRTSCT